jgi:hypothetical protein
MTWTTYEDVASRWVGSGAPTDETLVDALISDAEAVILSEFPRIQERIDDETLALPTVVMVVSRMVTRVLRNPEGLTYWQQTTGPFGQARNYGSTTQDIWLSSEEKELLSPKSKGKAFEVNLAPNALPGIEVPPYNGATDSEFGPYFGYIEVFDE